MGSLNLLGQRGQNLEEHDRSLEGVCLNVELFSSRSN